MTMAAWRYHSAGEVDEARERILDAAEAAVQRWGVARTRIDDIAAEARCGRTTIYRYFGNRDNVLVAVLLRQGQRYLDTLVEHLTTLPDTPEKLVEAIVFAVEMVRADENLHWVFNPDAAPVARVAGLSEALFDLAASVWLQFLRTDPTLERMLRPDVDPTLAAEWVLRTMLSYLTFPGRTGVDRRAMRRQLRQLLLPALFEGARP
jgi:AcrR family transcriptional regulator